MTVYVYIGIMALVTYAVRVLPMTLIRRPIQNTFIRSFLYYVPYVTLAIMTFPAIVEATETPLAGGVALLIGIILGWFGADLFKIAIACCGVVFVTEWILKLI